MRIILAEIPIDVTEPSEQAAGFLKDYAAQAEGEAFVSAEGKDLLMLHRQIAEQMPFFDRLVCHGALIEAGGKGIFITAPSGTGKTTHVRLWQKYAGDRVRVINGDKPILCVEEAGTFAYGTPWMGKERMGENSKVPLSAVVLLERGEKDRICREDPSKYPERILQQIYLPENRASAEKTYGLIDRLFARVPFYVFSCTMNKTAYDAAAGALLSSEDAERSSV